MEKVGKTLIISGIISAVIFAFCRYVNFYAMSVCNEGYNFSVAFMFAVSYSSLIWAYESYGKMNRTEGLQSSFHSNRNVELIPWFKELFFFYIHVVIYLCFILAMYLGKEESHYFISVLVGCIIFPCFYFAVYYLIVKLSGQYRAGLIVGLVLCTVEFVQINFVDPADSRISYDVLNLFSGFAGLYYYESFFWFIKMILIIVLMYVAAATIPKSDYED